ncbi:MAG: LysR family transcriptional regulator [Rhodopseudomonas sp.]|nr:LysR family transcriptional regulator [Rhodopseudomonas sp.]
MSLTNDIQRLQQFLCVIERGSIGRAAIALGMSQPALSKSLQRLEEVLAVKLFDRTPQGIVPTVFGQTLAAHARAILTEVRHAEDEINALQGRNSGRVRVGAGPSIIAQVLPRTIQAFLVEQPDTRVIVREGLIEELLAALVTADIDIAVVSNARGIDEDVFVHKPVRRDSLSVVAAASHPLARAGRCRLAELSAYRWVLPDRNEPVRHRFEAVFRAVGLSAPEPTVETNSALCMTSLVRDGGFLTWMPRLLIEDDRGAEPLVPIEVDDIAWERQLYVCWRRTTTQLPACARFAALLCATLDGSLATAAPLLPSTTPDEPTPDRSSAQDADLGHSLRL